MKMIAIKEGSKTKYRLVPDDYIEQPKDIATNTGDITCSDAKLVGLGFSEEQFNRIFKSSDSKNERK